MKDQTITFNMCYVTDKDTGIITAYIDDDYSTVTQGTDMDQIRRRLTVTRNLVKQARDKYGLSAPEHRSAVVAGFQSSELTYKVLA